MPIAYLTTPGLKASLAGERLDLTWPDNPATPPPAPEKRWISLADLEHVVVDSEVHLSSRSISGLLQRGIPVIFISNGKFPSGQALPFTRNVLSLGQQLDAVRDQNFRLAQAREIIVAKIQNQKRVLQRLAANREQPSIAASYLNSLIVQARATPSLDSLRGLEGAAAGRYFETLALYFPNDLPFERRSRRPPHNPPNALLSFLYTLLTQEFVLHLRACGLEPGWGLYHEADDGRPALALDLLEPFRAPIADAITLDLLNHKRLQTADFEYRDGGCFLKAASRRNLFTALEQRLEREFQHEQSNQRLTLRKIMRDHCSLLKKAFETRQPFAPFLMN